MLSPAELTISVIIPVYNGGKNFHRCLSSLAEAIPSPDAITVVADGDTDGSWRVAEQFGARVIRIPGPGGPARARNIGAHAAQGDILLFIDADVAVYPDILSRVAAAFRCEPDLAAVFGCYDDAPTETNFLSQYKNLLHHYVHQTASEKASTFWGACGAIRREVFLALGGFDETYRWLEDVELDVGDPVVLQPDPKRSFPFDARQVVHVDATFGHRLRPLYFAGADSRSNSSAAAANAGL